MSIFELDPRNSALVDNGSRVKDVVIGLVSEREFARAQAEIVDLANYVDYDDWLDAREGQQIGLAMAGVEAAKVCVSLSSFLQWRGLTEASCDERALDAFASLAFATRKASASNVLAVVSEYDFATHSGLIAAFAGRGGYRGWLRRRQSTRAKIEAIGGRIEELPVRVGAFVEWCSCLRQSASEVALDRYAQLLLEHLASETAA